MAGPDVFEQIEASSLATFIRQSSWLYPAIEVVHILGFVLLVGAAFLFDFRLLGLSYKNSDIRETSKYVLPWSRRGFLLVIPSGLLLFLSQAKTLSDNTVFQTKLILILLALINVAIFHTFTYRSASSWKEKGIPLPAKAAGLISIILWTSIITCGRFIAYF